MLQVRFRIQRLFIVPPGAFRPAPKVDSAVARLVPLGAARPRIADEALFAELVAAAFGQRRKTLRNALQHWATPGELEAAGIAPGARGETLAVATSCVSPTRWPRFAYSPQVRSGRSPGAAIRTILRGFLRRAPASLPSPAPRTHRQGSAINAALALPSTAGAARRIFRASPCTPATSVRFAPGCT